MSGLRLAGNGVIYRNPDPGHRHSSSLFPSPLEFPDDELMCCSTLGSALCAADLTFNDGPRYTVGFEPDNFSDFSRQKPVAKERLGALVELVRNESYSLGMWVAGVNMIEAIASHLGTKCGMRFAGALCANSRTPPSIIRNGF